MLLFLFILKEFFRNFIPGKGQSPFCTVQRTAGKSNMLMFDFSLFSLEILLVFRGIFLAIEREIDDRLIENFHLLDERIAFIVFTPKETSDFRKSLLVGRKSEPGTFDPLRVILHLRSGLEKHPRGRNDSQHHGIQRHAAGDCSDCNETD